MAFRLMRKQQSPPAVHDPNANILTQIRRQNWKHVRKQLRSKKGKLLVSTRECYCSTTTLSLACGCSAPLDVIEMMLDLDPKLALEKDDLYHSSPLHIACLNGAPLPIIKLLVEKYPALVPDQDVYGQTPLHHVIDFTFLNRKISPVNEDDRHVDYDDLISSAFEVIHLLLDASPETIHWADKSGNTPVDLLFNHLVEVEKCTSTYYADESVYSRVKSLLRFLQSTSICVYLHKKRRWEQKVPLYKINDCNSCCTNQEDSNTHKAVASIQTALTCDSTLPML